MGDYDHLGLNGRLQAPNLPAAKWQAQQASVPGYDWDAANARNLIGDSRLKTVKFDHLQGGTATLGGTANGNGVLVVNDAAGSTRVMLNNEGITVTGGSISIQNADGSAVWDESGLISSTNFTYGQGSAGTAEQTFTSTTYANVTGGSVSVAIARTANVLISYAVAGYHLEFDSAVMCRVVDVISGGTTVIGVQLMTRGGYDGLVPQSMSASFIQSLTAGTHSLNIQAKSATSGGTAVLSSGGLISSPAIINYLVLGT